MVYGVRLSGKRVKTAAGHFLEVPHARLGEALQAEWDRTSENPKPRDMPLTARVSAVIDIIAFKRALIEADTARYIDGDAICYFADSADEALLAHQEASRRAWLDWMERQLRTAPSVGYGVAPLTQSAMYKNCAMEILRDVDDWHFYALHNFIASCDSFILGYGLYRGSLTAAEAVAVSEDDALYQERRWGEDAQNRMRREALTAELVDIRNYLLLLEN